MCAFVTGVQTCALPIFVHAEFRCGGLQRLNCEGAIRSPESGQKTRGQTVGGGHDKNFAAWRHRSRDVGDADAQCVAELDSWYWNAGCRHRSEEHTSELQSLMRISYAVFCLKKKINTNNSMI